MKERELAENKKNSPIAVIEKPDQNYNAFKASNVTTKDDFTPKSLNIENRLL